MSPATPSFFEARQDHSFDFSLLKARFDGVIYQDHLPTCVRAQQFRGVVISCFALEGSRACHLYYCYSLWQRSWQQCVKENKSEPTRHQDLAVSIFSSISKISESLFTSYFGVIAADSGSCVLFSPFLIRTEINLALFA